MVYKKVFIILLFLLLLSSCNNKKAEKSLEEVQNEISEISSVDDNQSNNNSTNNDIPKNLDEKVILDILNWKHPVKDVLVKNNITINKLVLTSNETYPTFYIELPSLINLNNINRQYFIDIIKMVAEANAYWDFGIIDNKNKLDIKVFCDKNNGTIIKAELNEDKTFYTNENLINNDSSKTMSDNTILQKYIEFLKSNGKYKDGKQVMFFAQEDIDADGRQETIIAIGSPDKNPILNYISETYLLSENNGKIEQIGDNLSQQGYAAYEVKLIQLQNNKKKKYIYFGLTNGGNLQGFKIVELLDKQTKVICSSASATGAGNDMIKDFDNDGYFDGYIQNRWSYDVLYYSMTRTYKLSNNDFIISNTRVDIPKYPDKIEDVVKQYLTLRVLNIEKSIEVDKRILELCKYDKANNIEFSPEIWHPALLNKTLGINSQMKVTTVQNSDSSTVSVSYIDEKKNEYKHEFQLVKVDGKWVIDIIK